MKWYRPFISFLPLIYAAGATLLLLLVLLAGYRLFRVSPQALTGIESEMRSHSTKYSSSEQPPPATASSRLTVTRTLRSGTSAVQP